MGPLGGSAELPRSDTTETGTVPRSWWLFTLTWLCFLYRASPNPAFNLTRLFLSSPLHIFLVVRQFVFERRKHFFAPHSLPSPPKPGGHKAMLGGDGKSTVPCNLFRSYASYSFLVLLKIFFQDASTVFLKPGGRAGSWCCCGLGSIHF